MHDRVSGNVERLHRPRASEMPRCADCFDQMTAPEGSALLPDGAVSYLWSCDSCAKTMITKTEVSQRFRLIAASSH